MKQVASIIRLVAALMLCLSIHTACNSERQKLAEAKAVVEEISKELKPEMPVPAKEIMASGRDYLSAFYQDFETVMQAGEDSDEYLRANITPKAEQWFKDHYDYDCPDDRCLASWLLLCDITDPGSLKNRTVEALDPHTYTVKMTYDRGNGEIYQYNLKIGLELENQIFLIDTIEKELSQVTKK